MYRSPSACDIHVQVILLHIDVDLMDLFGLCMHQDTPFPPLALYRSRKERSSTIKRSMAQVRSLEHEMRIASSTPVFPNGKFKVILVDGSVSRVSLLSLQQLKNRGLLGRHDACV
jgi:hypothetical protein